MNSTIKVVLALSLAAIIGLSGFIGGYAMARFGPNSGSVPLVSDTGALDQVGARVDEVNELLQKDALKPPTETSATAGAIQGLLESNGDKYATYFDAKHFQYFNEDMAGEFGGIGVLLGEKDGSAYVVEVYEKTPAATVGIKQGDIFRTIDGITRDQWTTEEVVKRVRGKEGSVVKLTMVRPGAKDKPGAEKKFTVTRAKITFPNVRSEMKPGKVGYIRLGQFNEQATAEITKAIEALEKKGAKSFVLDLRDNPGGALNQAVTVSSLFIPSGVVVRVDERNKPETVYTTEGEKITDAPLVVLVNGNSASASEIVGGALQDYNRATLVGEKTFGKGSVQTISQLSFGGAVKFTTAHYLTPKKRVINNKGLLPDIVVKMDPEKQADEKTDTQLQRAILEAKKLQ